MGTHSEHSSCYAPRPPFPRALLATPLICPPASRAAPGLSLSRFQGTLHSSRTEPRPLAPRPSPPALPTQVVHKQRGDR